MSIPPDVGGRYTLPEDYPYDSVAAGSLPIDFDAGFATENPVGDLTQYDNIPPRPTGSWIDERFTDSRNPDPNGDGSDAGPLYASPAARIWLQQNVYDNGWLVDWGNREVYDKNGQDVGLQVPRKFGPIA